ncbi:MAG: NAD-dependent epimerase/dehydratase family protein [Cyanobacteriota bacterium]|jgi:nucleoside-diphosphate-sugar epimerase
MKVFLPGGAGLVGLNLIALLREQHPDWSLLVVDQKSAAVEIGRRLFPEVRFLVEDLVETRGLRWPEAIQDCEACVMLQAEIGNTDSTQFERNTLRSTEVVLAQMRQTTIRRLVHLSSSVVNSIASDFYSQTKRAQEELVLDHWPDAVVLRPTLMFGWFDRKHLGWLARFMRHSPLFPIPGRGRFLRQPLYVADVCQIIERCLVHPEVRGTFDISGLEKVTYLQLMAHLREAIGARTRFLPVPIPLFSVLLRLWALLSRRPAFTTSQLHALTAGDEFAVIDWPGFFGVSATPLGEALRITHQDPRYSHLEMPF